MVRIAAAAAALLGAMAPGVAFADHTTRFQGGTALGTTAIIATVVVFAVGTLALGGIGLWLARRDRRETQAQRETPAESPARGEVKR